MLRRFETPGFGTVSSGELSSQPDLKAVRVSTNGSFPNILLTAKYLHDPRYTRLTEFLGLWYIRSCRISVINQDGPKIDPNT